MQSTAFIAPPPLTAAPRPAPLEPSRLQFIERTFADLLPDSATGTALRTERLGWINEQLFVLHRPIAAVRAQLLQKERRPHIISVTSGKGGVGKTTISVNLAVTFAQQGRRVLLFDADLGMANAHVFAGVDPSRTLLDVIERRADLESVITPGPGEIDIICGASGVVRLAVLGTAALRHLTQGLARVATGYDVVIIDTGAGISPAVTAFFEITADVLVVATPNLAATLDAYGMLKVLNELALPIRANLLVNQSADEKDATQVADRIISCAERFLKFTPRRIGYLQRDPRLELANQHRTPLVMREPDSLHTHQFRALAGALLEKPARNTAPPPL